MELNTKTFFCTKWHPNAWTYFFRPLFKEKTMFPYVLSDHITFPFPIQEDSPSIHFLQVRRQETQGDVQEGRGKLEFWFWVPPNCLIHCPTFQLTIKWNWPMNLKGKKKRKKDDQIHAVNSGTSNEVTVSLCISTKQLGSEIQQVPYVGTSSVPRARS